ncbi:MAG: TolC family protein [Pseudobdellovibrionaceae bacterium]
MLKYIGLAIFAVSFGTHSAVQAETLSRQDALALVAKNNPLAIAARSNVEAANGAFDQARLMPNPQASLEIENAAGTDQYNGYDEAETTLSISQEIEVAGKRAKRSRIADYDRLIASQNAVVETLNILADTDYAFMRALIAKERLQLADKRLELAEQSHIAVKKRVTAAAASSIQHTKIDIEQSAAVIQKKRAEQEYAQAHAALAALLSQDAEITGETALSKNAVLPSEDELMNVLEQTPLDRIAELSRFQAQSRLDLAQSQAIPNPTIGLGVRHFGENSANALVAGFSIPIPVLNRNQGNIREAHAEVARSHALADQQRLALREMARNAFTQAIAAEEQVKAYTSEMLPSAERAYKQASDGYNAGRFSFLDLLDAQRTLYEVQEQRLDSLSSFYLAKSRIDFLMGTHMPLLDTLTSSSKGNTQ